MMVFYFALSSDKICVEPGDTKTSVYQDRKTVPDET